MRKRILYLVSIVLFTSVFLLPTTAYADTLGTGQQLRNLAPNVHTTLGVCNTFVITEAHSGYLFLQAERTYGKTEYLLLDSDTCLKRSGYKWQLGTEIYIVKEAAIPDALYVALNRGDALPSNRNKTDTDVSLATSQLRELEKQDQIRFVAGQFDYSVDVSQFSSITDVDMVYTIDAITSSSVNVSRHVVLTKNDGRQEVDALALDEHYQPFIWPVNVYLLFFVLLTLIIEGVVVYKAQLRRRKFIVAFVVVNVLTNMFANMVSYTYYFNIAAIVKVEAFIIAGELAVLLFFDPRKKRVFVTVLIANILSALVGFLLFMGIGYYDHVQQDKLESNITTLGYQQEIDELTY